MSRHSTDLFGPGKSLGVGNEWVTRRQLRPSDKRTGWKVRPSSAGIASDLDATHNRKHPRGENNSPVSTHRIDSLRKWSRRNSDSIQTIRPGPVWSSESQRGAPNPLRSLADWIRRPQDERVWDSLTGRATPRCSRIPTVSGLCSVVARNSVAPSTLDYDPQLGSTPAAPHRNARSLATVSLVSRMRRSRALLGSTDKVDMPNVD